ncbi:MAG TPA: hypothetical protein VMT03_00590 [Polyangia bacterium]|nr:hypothetical protein [Polyangia bacterium]
MTRLRKSFFMFSLVALTACAQTQDMNGSGTGGSGSGTGGSGTGGTSSSTGGNGSGGSSTGGSATGGSNPGTGGAVHTGGMTGAAGHAGSGSGGTATGGSGGAHTGSGGTAGAGQSTGAGGASAQGGLFTIMAQLASAMKSTAPPTVAIVTWSITKSGITSAHIDFGPDTSYGMTAPVDLTVASYRTLLLGMKPGMTYHFRIVASDGTNTYTSDDQTIMTGAKISSNPLTSFSVKNAASLPKGFFITSFWQGSNSKVPFIFDTDGDVVWWYTAGSGESTDGISRARMSADSQSIWLVNESLSGNPLRRVTMDGLTTQTYSSTKASHDIAAVSADTMAYLDYSESDCNSIFEINNAGTTKEVFEPTGVTGTGKSFPSCHGNSVRYSKKEDYYTYSDWQEDVAVVNRTGTLQWLLSKKVSGGHTAWGGEQHGTQLLDNSILIFANQGTAGKSQAVEYGLDGHLIKAFNANGSSNVTNFGDVQRLSNGNTIITYSTNSLMQEVDSSDTVVLEVKGSGSFGYVEFRDSLYGPPLDIAQ